MTTPFWYPFWYGTGASVAIVVYAICASSHTTSRRWWTTAILVFSMTQAAGIYLALDAGGNLTQEGMNPLLWAILAGSWIAGTVANLAILYSSIRSSRRDENRWRQRPAVVVLFAVTWTLAAFMSTSAVASLVGLSAVRNAATSMATSSASSLATPQSRIGAPERARARPAQPQRPGRSAAPIDLAGAHEAALRGNAWVWNNHSTDEPPCHTTLRLPDGRQIEPPRQVTTAGTRVSLDGGALKYLCTSSSTSSAPSRGAAFSIESAAAAFRDGVGFLWLDACGHTRLAVTATEVYTIPAASEIPPGGAAVRPDPMLNTCHEQVEVPSHPAQPAQPSRPSSPAKPTGWSHP